MTSRAAALEPLEENLGGPVGIRWIRGGARSLETVRTDAPTLLLPLERTVLRVHGAARGSEGVLLDAASLMLVPKGRGLRCELRSPSVQLLWLTFGDEIARRTVEEYRGEVEPKRLDAILRSSKVLARTQWVNEVAHRYLFERFVCEKHSSLAARFLEVELVKELYFVSKEADGAHARTSMAQKRSPMVAAALAAIEADLFGAFAVETLAKKVGTSPSTLLRAFKREVGQTPSELVRQRRLDEALLLLQSGRYTVAETAFEVGYDNAAAFSHAFHRRFGKTPSEVHRRSR